MKLYFSWLVFFIFLANTAFCQTIIKKRGKVTTSYSNGKKESSGKVKNYKKQGLWKYWDESGKLEKSITYKDDKKNGLFTEFYEDGSKLQEGNYVNDLKDSEWKSWYKGNVYSSLNQYGNGKKNGVQKYWYSNGQLMQQQQFDDDVLVYDWTWFDNGRKKNVKYYRGGLPDGTWRTYADPNESNDTLPISIDNYSNGKKNGLHSAYYRGKLSEEIFYKDDKLNGSYKKWDSNSMMGISENYVNGNKDGVCKYFNHGKCIREVMYSNGRIHGTEKEFEESGMLFRISWFNKGRVDSTHNFHPNGKISISRNYKYYPGFVTTEEFSTYTEWDTSGVLLLKGTFHFEMKDKDWTTFYANGKIKSITPFTAGKIKGVYKKWYANGKPLIEMECEGNNVITQPKVWDENGKPMKAGTKRYQEIVDSSKPGEIYNDPKKYRENRTAQVGADASKDENDLSRGDPLPEVPGEHNQRDVQFPIVDPRFQIDDDPRIKTDTSEVFTFVEQMPYFPDDGLQKFIKNNLKYPEAYKDTNLPVTVWVSFIVERNGLLTNVQVVKGVPAKPLFDKEALRLISIMPKWSPGKMNGKTVRVLVTQPVKFNFQ